MQHELPDQSNTLHAQGWSQKVSAALEGININVLSASEDQNFCNTTHAAEHAVLIHGTVHFIEVEKHYLQGANQFLYILIR